MKDKLVNYLKDFTWEDIKQIEENDPQFLALKKLWKYKNDPLQFTKLVITNALLSYQLQTKGETYWQNFADFFALPSKTLSDFEEFISLYNKRLINQRKKRLSKISNCLNLFDNNFFFKSVDNPVFLLNFLTDCLNQKKDAKTVVFAIKMFLYAIDIIFQKHFIAPFGIMIPLDSRIKKISADKKFWQDVEKETQIPLLHIDSILWLPTDKDFIFIAKTN